MSLVLPAVLASTPTLSKLGFWLNWLAWQGSAIVVKPHTPSQAASHRPVHDDQHGIDAPQHWAEDQRD
jgi:hypothetical protein